MSTSKEKLALFIFSVVLAACSVKAGGPIPESGFPGSGSSGSGGSSGGGSTPALSNTVTGTFQGVAWAMANGEVIKKLGPQNQEQLQINLWTNAAHTPCTSADLMDKNIWITVDTGVGTTTFNGTQTADGTGLAFTYIDATGNLQTVVASGTMTVSTLSSTNLQGTINGTATGGFQAAGDMNLTVCP